MPGVITNEPNRSRPTTELRRETLEDYTAVGAAQHRRWPPAVVASPLSASPTWRTSRSAPMSGITWGTANAVRNRNLHWWSSSPACRWPTAARYSIDLNLIYPR